MNKLKLFLISIIMFLTFTTQAANYSINLVFINPVKRVFDEEMFNKKSGPYPFGVGKDLAEQKGSFSERLAIPAINWAKTNDLAEVNVWLDYDFLDQGIIDNTKALFDELLQINNLAENRVDLRNIRELNLFQQQNAANVFNNEELEVYIRADLARAIVAHEMLTAEPEKAFIYVDLDLKGEDLSNKLADEKLNANGYVMSSKGLSNEPYENNFFIMKNIENNPFVRAHFENLIERPITLLNKMMHDPEERELENPNWVYDFYRKLPRSMTDKWMEEKEGRVYKDSPYQGIPTIEPPLGTDIPPRPFFNK